MAAMFVNGKPARITPADFRRFHLAQFPKLAGEDADALLDQVIGIVYDMFTGVGTLWQRHGTDVWYEKTRTCYTLLVAWYIADVYPRYAAGIPGIGGVPVKSKRVGPVAITYQDMTTGTGSALNALLSNAFGKMARLMIDTAAERTRIRSRIQT